MLKIMLHARVQTATPLKSSVRSTFLLQHWVPTTLLNSMFQFYDPLPHL